jgi:histidinol-phosphate aminotransferase
MLRTVDDIKYQRDRLSLELAEMGFEVFRSESNFVLFSGLKDSASAFEQLLEVGILVRNVGIPNTLRVSAGTEAETTAFLEAARDLVKL